MSAGPWLRVLLAVLAATAVMAGALWLHARRRERVAAALGGGAMTRRLLGEDLGRAPRLRYLALLLAAGALGAAAADPRWGTVDDEARAAGTVVLVLDASNSMLVRDTPPSRLERLRRLASELVEALNAQRVGVVVFAGRAYVLSPPTPDAGALRLYLDALDPQVVAQTGSSLAAALRQGIGLAASASGQVAGTLVLVSDGDALEPEAAVLAEAARARAAGVGVLAVGVGSAAGGPVPDLDPGTGRLRGYKREPTGELAVSRLNEPLLRALAERAGGTYLHAAEPDAAARVLAALRRQPAARGGRDDGAEPAPRYGWLVALALGLLLADAFAERRTPREGAR